MASFVQLFIGTTLAGRTRRGPAGPQAGEQSVDRGGRPRGWQGYRRDSHEENRGCLGRESVAFREAVHRASQPGAYRRLVGLLQVGEGRLGPGDHSCQRAGEIRVRVDAPRPPRRVTAQALAAGQPSGRCESPASGLLPRRVQLTLQSPQIQEPRQTLLSVSPAGGSRGPRDLQDDRSPSS